MRERYFFCDILDLNAIPMLKYRSLKKIDWAGWTGSFKLKGVFSRCCVHGRMCPEKFFRAHFTIDIALGHISGHISSKLSKDTGLKSEMCPHVP